MGLRSERGVAASGLVVGVALIVLVVAVSFVLLTKRAGEEAASANQAALDEAAVSEDRVAQSWLRNGLVAGKTVLTDLGGYGDVTPAMLAQVEPSLMFTAGASTEPGHVSVAVTDQQLGLAMLSATGTCWTIRDDASGTVTTYGSGAPCTGEVALATATQASW